jgi:hypothetical protein
VLPARNDLAQLIESQRRVFPVDHAVTVCTEHDYIGYRIHKDLPRKRAQRRNALARQTSE